METERLVVVIAALVTEDQTFGWGAPQSND